MKYLKLRIGTAIIALATLTLVNFRPISAVAHSSHKKPSRSLKKSWQIQLEKEFTELEKQYPNQIGLYLKDLNTGEEYSLHGDESMYLASTVKVPIAIEVLAQVDAKKLSLEDKVTITLDDYVDGNGPLKTMKPGDQVSIRYLIEQMIVYSDNMASDMLIRTVGLDKINTLAQKLMPGSAPITTLKDVRRHIYSELHTSAFELPGKNFMELNSIQDPNAKLEKFASFIRSGKEQMNRKNIHEAYEAYYHKGLNSASPRNYSKVLEMLWEGKILAPSSQDFLVKTMLKTETGKNRIKAGLKHPWVFAHKTGTQYQRIVDVGYIWNPKNINRKPIIVVSFVKNINQKKVSARLLEKVGKVISDSGVL